MKKPFVSKYDRASDCETKKSKELRKFHFHGFIVKCFSGRATQSFV